MTKYVISASIKSQFTETDNNIKAVRQDAIDNIYEALGIFDTEFIFIDSIEVKTKKYNKFKNN